MAVIIRAEHLSKHYRNLRAVDDISFSVQQGEVYGFLGQNGAGKSTTIRMLLTLIEPTNGSIEIFGMNLLTHRKKVLRQIGAVIERPDLYKYLTGYENLSLFAKMSGVRVTDKMLLQQLQKVGLKERAHSKVKTYSQGMKQRLGLAVALIHDPQLIILDEPTNGLDPQGIADVRNLILHLSREEGKTIFISSHLLSEIEMIADRMLILDQGKKIVEGSVEELFNPANMVVELKIANPAHTLAQLQNSRWAPFIQKHYDEYIIFRMGKTDIPSLAGDLVNLGATILSLTPQHSLEAYFLSLTTGNQHVDDFKN